MKERLVTCNEEDTDGQARLTADEVQVLPVDCREGHCIDAKVQFISDEERGAEAVSLTSR